MGSSLVFLFSHEGKRTYLSGIIKENSLPLKAELKIFSSIDIVLA